MTTNNKKLILVGWDGATFDIITPMLDAGRLPNLKSLLDKGVHAPLDSTIPALTPTAWTSISTGVNPGKHGIFDAFIYSAKDHKVRFVNASMRKARAVWQILSDRNRTSGVLNVPVTYPTDPVQGYMIPGMFTPGSVPQLMHPAELNGELKREFGTYNSECRTSDNPAIYLKKILEMVEDRERVICYLMKNHPQDFQFFAFMASDRVQHFFWKFRDPEHPQHDRFGDAIETVYDRLDQALGRIIAQADDDATIMMVSDHGAGPLNTAFYLNNWLQQNGYLVFKKSTEGNANVASRSPLKLKIRRLLQKTLPHSLVKRLGLLGTPQELNFFLSRIDWEKTRAFSEGVASGIYVNRKIVGADEYDRFVHDLCRELTAITGPDSEKVMAEAHPKTNIYHGDQTDNAPDIVLVCNTGYSVIAPNEMVFFDIGGSNQLFFPHRWSGRHEAQGIFAAAGPKIKAQGAVANCSVIDIAPTILYLMGESVPGNMDGRVLTEAIHPDALEQQPIMTSENETETGHDTAQNFSDEEEELIVERMRNLGYME